MAFEAVDLARRFAQLPAEKRRLFLEQLAKRGIDFSILPITPGEGAAAGLSYAQRRMWFLRELGGDGAVQHIAGGLRLGGTLDRAALEAALAGLVARHDGLRTVFRRLADGEAEPVVREAADVPLAFEDLSGLPQAERQARLDALSASEAREPLDLDAGPLLRATLVRLQPDRHELLLTMHHIVSDGWSVRILLGELLQLYAAACPGETVKLPELPIRYADYAAWQRNLLDAGGLEPQLAFWRGTLGEAAVPPIALPFDRPRPAVQSHRGGKLSFALDAELAAKLRQLAASRNVTLVTVLLAAFNALLWRISGAADLRVGLPVAGRNRRETESIVGLFVNTLVLRCQVDGAAGFTGLIGQVRDRLIAAQANQDLPFEMLVEALAPDRDLSHSPLVQVMYNHQPLALGALPPVAGLTVEAFARDGGGQQFDLVLETEETAAGSLSASFGYASDLFHHDTIARMAGHFTRLLRRIAADPDARLDSIELVTADELAALSAPCPVAGGTAEQPVHRLISAQAARRPDAPAVICADATLSFAALEAQANRLAWHLLRRGIGPEDRIGVMMERSPAQITALLGVLKAGAAFLPLDSQQPSARLAQMLADSGARLVLTETGLAAPGGVPVLNLDTLDLSEESPAAPDIAIHPEQLAYLIYTSGSTGLPKAVAVAHGPLSRHCQATAEFYEMDERSRELHLLSFAFDGAHERWITPLILGGSIVMRGPELWDAGDTLAAMARHKVTNAGFPAAYLQQVARAAADDATPPPKLRMVSFGGEAMPRGGFELIKRALQPELLINGYGPTEAVISPLAWKAAATQGFEGAYAPIGRAIGRRRAYILDAGLNPVPQGVAGELYIGGDIARGYHARPGLTAERFLPDPFAAGGGARMLRTGDRVRLLADGNVEYLGRLDAQMKLRGFRIEPGEIEARLIDHETVSAAAVALHETPSGPRLTGYVVPVPGAAPDPATLRASLARALPAYMVPARILAIDAIPLTPTGKIDRAALPVPPAEDAGQLTPPATELEAELAEIWRQTLKIQHIGTNQNFFELGGDSLAALEVLTRIRKLLPDRKVTIADLFNNQDIKHLAAALSADAIGSVQVVHLRRQGTRPMLYCFPGLMVNTREYMPLIQHLGADQPATGFVCYSLTEDAKRVVSVEGIAANYADYIRQHGAGRPCVLLGWSWGGVLAFEAARMLASDVDVRFVGMLDVINLDVNFAVGTLAAIDAADRARLERRIAAWLDKTPLRSDWEALFARMSADTYTQFLRYVQTVGEALPTDGPGIGSKEYELWTFLDNTLLYQHYKMQPFDAPIHVWQAEDSVRRGLDLVDWRRHSGRVERVMTIPGVTHRQIVDAPAFHASFRESVEAAWQTSPFDRARR